LVRYDAKSGQFLPYLDGASISEVSFSPDGQWVAYVTYPNGILWRSRVDGTQKLQLTSETPEFANSPGGPQMGSRSLFPAATPIILPACM
jgi:Tol biopolymer transport system component